jgi:signal transduction histidine kinase
VPVVHRGEDVGEIAVARRPGDPLRPADNRLLDALASQAGMALEGIRLADQLRARLTELQGTTRELAASRRRIVTARDAERSRLERQIHDRVERRLLEMAEALERAERTLPRSRPRAMALLDGVAAEANEVQEALRDLARGIFPPLLSDKGLVPALESQARKFGVPLVVAAGLQERFDPRAEAAVYFCCVEALRPLAGHPDGPPVTVEVAADGGWIRFVVREGGRRGGDASASDLQVLADRVEAVGGRLEIRMESVEGWTISGRVPAQLPTAVQTSASLSGSKADFGT